jgi:pantoate--beta-alanine ligase
MTIKIKTPEAWQQHQETFGDKTLGLVPTMGNLHAGHLSLLQRSVAENDLTVMSCFVNPAQFNSTTDLENYPRTLAEDFSMAEEAGVDYFFMPEYEALYPDAYRYQVLENRDSLILEGVHRPGHFEGVLTVVLKLLLLLKADHAYFGEKDYQQLQLVKGMVEAFFIRTDIIGCPIVRNDFGLPLSSRNRLLSADQLELSRQFPACFHTKESCNQIAKKLERAGFNVEYIKEQKGRRFSAVWLGDIRLIDNIDLKSDI